MNIYESIKKNSLTEADGYSEFKGRVLAVYEKLAKKSTPVSVFLIWNELRNGKGSEKNDEFFPGTEELDNFEEDYDLIRKILKGKKLKETENLSETNYLKKYYNQLDTMTDKELYNAWLDVKDAPDEEGGPEEIEYTLASDALWEIEGELCRRGYLDEDNNKTDKWKELTESTKLTESFDPETVSKRIARYKEHDKHVLHSWYEWSVEESEAKAKEASLKDPNDVYYVQYDNVMEPCSNLRYVNGVEYDINDGGFHWVNGLPKFHTDTDWDAVRKGEKTWEEIDTVKESVDVARDLAIEPGSTEEEILNGLYEEKKIDWTDLEGSDQTAVEHYYSRFGRDFTGKCWDDVESDIRSACHDIGYANEELIDEGYWNDGDMDPEPNERSVMDYIFYNDFIPFINKNKKSLDESEDGIRKKQLINNIEDLVYCYDNGISDGDFEPFKSDEELVKYVYTQVFDQKSDGQGGTRYGTGICRDLKYLGKDYIISEIKRIGHEAGVVKEEITEAEESSRFIEISSKSVEDSDGFMTDYTLYHDTENNKYVTVFGDKDIYTPEDESYDMEFDTENEANEWFHSYTGFEEAEEEFKETPKSVASLKSLLEDLADRDFYHEMKDHWTHEDFEFSNKLNKQINDVIAQLKEQGIDAKYRTGYPIEYSDEIQKEAEEDKLTNDEWFKLHEEEVAALDAEPFEISKAE